MALPDGSEDKKDKARTRDLLERIASIHKSLDRDKQVLAAYERMGKVLGMDDEILGSMASWHKGKKRIDQARAIYGRYKDQVNGRRAIAGSYREEKNYEEAVRQYLSLIGLDKDREADWQRDAVGTWRDASKWDKAIATYQTLLKVDPDRFSDYNWGIAECHEKLSKWKEAILSYRQTDKFPEAYFRMAECHRHLKKWNEGLILLNQARSHENRGRSGPAPDRSVLRDVRAEGKGHQVLPGYLQEIPQEQVCEHLARPFADQVRHKRNPGRSDRRVSRTSLKEAERSQGEEPIPFRTLSKC